MRACVPVDVVLGGRRDEDDGVGVDAVLPQRLRGGGGEGGGGGGDHRGRRGRTAATAAIAAAASCRHGAPAHTGSGGRCSLVLFSGHW